jgi:hypothetical protein
VVDFHLMDEIGGTKHVDNCVEKCKDEEGREGELPVSPITCRTPSSYFLVIALLEKETMTSLLKPHISNRDTRKSCMSSLISTSLIQF